MQLSLKIKLQRIVMTFSRLRTWLFFGNLFDYLIISTFSHTGMIIDGNVLVKMGIKPFFPICQFLECLRIVFEGVNHGLSASLCGRVEGVERTTSRSRKWANFGYLSLRLFRGQRSHRYLSAKTDKRTSYNDFDWFQIRQNYGALKVLVFDKEKHLRWSKLPKPCNQHKRCGINAKPSEKRARKEFKKIN